MTMAMAADGRDRGGGYGGPSHDNGSIQNSMLVQGITMTTVAGLGARARLTLLSRADLSVGNPCMLAIGKVRCNLKGWVSHQLCEDRYINGHNRSYLPKGLCIRGSFFCGGSSELKTSPQEYHSCTQFEQI